MASRDHVNRPKHWTYSCGLCRRDHPIKTCPNFLALDPMRRFEVVCDYSYCLNCLARSHSRVNCQTELRCQICGEKHHTLLHYSPQLIELAKEQQLKPNPQAKRPQEQPTKRTPSTQRSTSHTPRTIEKVDKRPREQALERTPSPPTTSRAARHLEIEKRHSSPPQPTARASRPSERPSVSGSQRRLIRSASEFKMQPRPATNFNWARVFIPTAHVRIARPQEVDMWHTCRMGINLFSPVSKISKGLQIRIGLETFIHNDMRFAKFQATGRSPRCKWSREIRALVTNDLPRPPYEKVIEADPTVGFPPGSLADPEPWSNIAIEIELGADEFHGIHRNGSLSCELETVIALQTALGYVFIGPTNVTW